MDNASKVAAIITTHRRAPEILGRAIESVLRQTVPAAEVVVVDDAPSWERHGDILALMQRYAGRVRYIENTDRPGACGSRNIGIESTVSPIIGLLDDDDEWIEDKIEVLLPAFTGGAGIVYGTITKVREGSSFEFHPNNNKEYFSGMIYDELIQHGNFVGGCSVPLFTRDAVVRAGMFDEQMLSGQDIDLWLRIAKNDEAVFVDKPAIKYYFTDDAISATSKSRISGKKRLLEKYGKDYKRYPDVMKRRVGGLLLQLILAGQINEAWTLRKEYAEYISKAYFVKQLLKGMVKRVLFKLRIQNR